MKIFLSGGGTLGPVTPLLAMQKSIARVYPDVQFLWVGTKDGPERELVTEARIPFVPIRSGKLRRYFSLRIFFDLFGVAVGFFQSVMLVWKEDPTLCISAGGYTSVPLHLAAWLFGVPTWVHQQDVRVGLANRLMAPFAKQVTTALEINVKKFAQKKTFHLGNPVRSDLYTGSKKKAKTLFGLLTDKPVIFATGGGTGSMKVNQMVIEALHHLEGECEVIHLSGKERPQELVERTQQHFVHYHPFVFFTDEMKHAYAAADIVISRGGFGTLTEIAALGKAAIIIPKPGHQEENVHFLAEQDAVVLVDERTSDGHYLANTIRTLLADTKKIAHMGHLLQTLLPPAKDEDITTLASRFLNQ